uniref:Uncharacterized protein n=1 Tax=Entamoeba invadens TaxID=33085 RepID=S0B5F2_ENTIV|nr:hypothetical protein, conserved [Entamoeba invadens]
MRTQSQSNSPMFPLGTSELFGDTISGIDGYKMQNGFLVATASWDKTCKAFFVTSPTNIQGASQVTATTPITCLTKMQNNLFAYGTAGGAVEVWSVEKNQKQQVSQHQSCVTSIKFIASLGALITSSLDGTIMLTELNSGKSTKMPVAGPVVAMDQFEELTTYSTPGRIEVFNIQAGKPMTETLVGGSQSKINVSVQSMKMFPDKAGLVYGGNDGRANVINFTNRSNQYTYAFKAQHKRISKDVCNYFPVNSISFFNKDVFLTAGSDGTINIWDRVKKSFVNSLGSPVQGASITTADFIWDGAFLGYSVGYDWVKGVEGTLPPQQQLPVLKVVDEPLIKS